MDFQPRKWSRCFREIYRDFQQFSPENNAFQSLSLTLIFQRFSAVPLRKNGTKTVVNLQMKRWSLPIKEQVRFSPMT
jgi:hypothetical protein